MKKKDTNLLHTRAEKLAQATFLLARACEDKEKYFTKLFNITNAEFRCMRFLDCDCPYSVKDLAQIMGLTSGRVTQIITTLEQKKYITREIDLEDRRNIKIRLTEAAEPYLKNVTEKHIELHKKVLGLIPEETQESVLIALDELLKSLTNWSKTNK
jgi:DNA-binding MarR family transcriptional regulator